ncbi:MAG: hypothetical protein DRQ88_00355 [Epsilonproteobacteria bacterium]|nr:MAG: hypothetical protein DRQ89_03435 [Campylobacterota bacterium]RLA68087.1 MAG: hypothetical protein DRQ88_00355 [Campylobacterota bacterium]
MLKKLILLIFILNAPLLLSSDKWNLVSKDRGISLYELKNPPKGGMLPFRAEKVINLSLRKLLYILVDYKNKSQWAPKLKSVTIHKKLGISQFLFSEYYDVPWPFNDRQFLLKGQVVLGGDFIHITAHSVNDKKFFEKDHVRADVDMIDVKLYPITKEKTKIVFEFLGNMGGYIPVFVQNIIRRRWPHRFIEAIEKYAKTTKNLASSDWEGLMKNFL